MNIKKILSIIGLGGSLIACVAEPQAEGIEQTIIEKTEDGWYVGQLEEIPAVLSQGKTIEELKENLLDALNLLLETNKAIVKREYSGRRVIRKKLSLA